MYRRCKPEEKENPFGHISLVDLSVNRQGTTELLSEAKDVLLNTSPTEKKPQQRFSELAIVTLEIKELAGCGTYDKAELIGENFCIIYLVHRPEPCNYAHAAFEIYYNGREVTFNNYKKTLGKNNKLRTWCKQQLANMIVKEEVRLNWTVQD